ncbi:hypothetical protein [Lactococcus allomyrinae]|uniref:Uncharacterized protein n=1 Tax=Lactococcus allomyrinae TaxID=2419773 RepID=A0A387BUA9_9LACT|nr:hypothetical protein [Lactococcus allomyrinae]AYG02051.1 hypothetical protein D7I46_13005 [Lactococcus allomyrinae]
MKINPMTWTKNQKITGVVVLSVLILGGITVGVVSHQNQVHAQQVAQEKASKLSHERKVKALEKKKAQEAEAEEKVKSFLDQANQNPSDATIKAVNTAIAQLSSETKQEQYLTDLKPITARLSLLNKARAAVKDYQAHATDSAKQKLAQEAINALKDKNDADVKAELQKQYDASRKQAEDAAKAKTEQADKTADTTNNNQAQSNNNSAQSSGSTSTGTGTSYSPSTPNYDGSNNTGSNHTNQNNNTGNNNSNGGNSGGNSNNGNTGGGSSSGGNSGGNTGGGSTTPPSTTIVWRAWVKNGAGVIVATKDFSDYSSASSWGLNYANEHIYDLLVNGKPGSYGAYQVEV